MISVVLNLRSKALVDLSSFGTRSLVPKPNPHRSGTLEHESYQVESLDPIKFLAAVPGFQIFASLDTVAEISW